MDFKVVTAKNKTEHKKFARIALKNHLYIAGWCLSDFLRMVRDDSRPCEISLAYNDEDVPIGVSLLLESPIHVPGKIFINETGHNIAIFVNSDYRRMGVGSGLINSLKDKRSVVFACRGAHGSLDFYKSLKITMERGR